MLTAFERLVADSNGISVMDPSSLKKIEKGETPIFKVPEQLQKLYSYYNWLCRDLASRRKSYAKEMEKKGEALTIGEIRDRKRELETIENARDSCKKLFWILLRYYSPRMSLWSSVGMRRDWQVVSMSEHGPGCTCGEKERLFAGTLPWEEIAIRPDVPIFDHVRAKVAGISAEIVREPDIEIPEISESVGILPAGELRSLYCATIDLRMRKSAMENEEKIQEFLKCESQDRGVIWPHLKQYESMCVDEELFASLLMIEMNALYPKFAQREHQIFVGKNWEVRLVPSGLVSLLSAAVDLSDLLAQEKAAGNA